MSRLDAIKQRLALYKSDGLSEDEINWLLEVNTDLLQALEVAKATIKELNLQGGTTHQWVFYKINAAIAKAKGGE